MRVKCFVLVASFGLASASGLAQERAAGWRAKQCGLCLNPQRTHGGLAAWRSLGASPRARPGAGASSWPQFGPIGGNGRTVQSGLAQAAAGVQAARGQYVQAGLYPNPVIGYQASEIGDEGRAGQQGAFVSQEIVTAGKLELSRNVASQEIRQAECVWQSQRFRVLSDVRRSFYDVLVAQRAMELSQQLVRIGEEGVKLTEALIKAKEVARVDVLQARIEADSAKIFLEKARNRHAAAWRGLVAVVGDPMMPPAPLAGDLLDGMAQLGWEDTLSRLLAESPQLAVARAGVDRAEAALCRACAERTPNLDVQTSVQYDNATRDTIAGVQVGVPLPIFNRNQGNICKAQAELAAAQQEVARVQLALQQRFALVFEQYATAYGQVEKYRGDILPNAQESLKLVSAGYRQGEFSYLVLLTAQRTYFQTSLAYLDVLAISAEPRWRSKATFWATVCRHWRPRSDARSHDKTG